MTFWEHFLRLLPYRPVKALAAVYWHITRRRVRARNCLRIASADLPFAYDIWIDRIERNSNLGTDVRAALAQWSLLPRFSVLLHDNSGYAPQDLDRSIKSVESQLYPFWALGSGSSATIESQSVAANDDYVVPLRVGDALSPAALYRFAEAVQQNPEASILYGDQDEMDERGRRRRPWFKPRWNEELFLAQDYLSAAVALKANLALQAVKKEGRDVHDLLLITTSLAEGPVVHVPHILVHVDSRSEDTESRRLEVVEHHVRPLGASCKSGPFGTIKVEWPLPEELPLVSLIIPTRDKLELLEQCVGSLLSLTDYSNFEILIVDNRSVEERTAKFLREIGNDRKVRVLNYGEAFNYSAINNFAARHARGSYLCLLNNDTEIVEPSWLTELMRYAVRPGTGAVGAKLLYEDGSIQHAGVVVGICEAAGHAHRSLPAGEPGYFRMAHVAQFVSAVTGACLVVEKEKFDAVGGLDEESLAVAYNDVDLCLKLETAGWRNVYVPHAVLVHHESKSRGSDMAPSRLDEYLRELAVLQDRWDTKTYDDPLHNPNLDRYSETYVFRL